MALSEKVSLPSSSAAHEFVCGQSGATFRVLSSTVLRSGLVFPGLLLAQIEPKKALVGALLASVGITAFVLAFTAATTKSCSTKR